MTTVPSAAPRGDVLCLSHLRWNFVFQRPQHLMTRCARERRVFFIEEPIVLPSVVPQLRIETHAGVNVVVPQLPAKFSAAARTATLRRLIDDLIEAESIREYLLWYYTPMALEYTDHLCPSAIIYDCMDELSAFKGAPAALKVREADLLRRCSVVLTGGRSLHEAKRHQHENMHLFPSSVDVAHFGKARRPVIQPPDQAAIPHPRLGFFGVIDERLDVGLLDGVAAARPDWHFIMLGPVVKIDSTSLPQRRNIHYLGSKEYEALPAYIATWDVALLPFAHNAATRFISPTKTPEYLAAGKPVVSTSIRDVVRPYGDQGLVRIADDVDGFVRACSAAMVEDASARLTRADAFLRQTSWDGTWSRIRSLVHDAMRGTLVEERCGFGDDAAAV